MMPPPSLRAAARIYNWLLGLYPAPFRARFRAEMLQVFRSLSRDIFARDGLTGLVRFALAVIGDQLLAIVQQWRLHLFRRKGSIVMEPSTDTHQVKPLSLLAAVLGALPFFGYGLSIFLQKVNFPAFLSPQSSFWQLMLAHPHFVLLWLTLAGLGAGILLGFPRWAYPYLGWALLLTWSVVNGRFYMHKIHATIWLPLVGVILAGFLIRRSLQPLINFLRGFKRDWTILSLGLACFYTFALLHYDSNHHPNLLVFLSVSTLAVSLGVWGYFRSRRAFGRAASLLGGLFLAMLLSEISFATWDYASYYNLPSTANGFTPIGLYFFAIMALLMLAPALAARRREARQV